MRSFCLFVTAFLIALFIASGSYAETTYKIRAGDNPYSIAKKFRVSPDDIISINGIDPARLRPGSRIKIPTGKGIKPINTASQVIQGVKDMGTAKKPDDERLYRTNSSFHVVKKGDTISSLSRSYSIPPHTLMAINNLRSAKLKIGQKLALKWPEAADYTVQKGDTIWDISRRFDIDREELIAINGLDTESLKPGQKILLKPPVATTEVKQYETILSQSREEQQNTQHMTEVPAEPVAGLEERLLLFAKKMLDIPYRFGGNSLIGIDCSAYVKKVYSLIGIDLPRSAREQFQEGIPVQEHELTIGDLVFFRTYASYPSHVGIYLGNNLFIHASSKKKRVTIDSLDTPFYVKRFIGAKRLLGLDSKGVELGKDG